MPRQAQMLARWCSAIAVVAILAFGVTTVGTSQPITTAGVCDIPDSIGPCTTPNRCDSKCVSLGYSGGDCPTIGGEYCCVCFST